MIVVGGAWVGQRVVRRSGQAALDVAILERLCPRRPDGSCRWNVDPVRPARVGVCETGGFARRMTNGTVPTLQSMIQRGPPPMSVDAFRTLEAIVNHTPGARLGTTGIPPKLLDDIERLLNVTFPPSFRHYLLEYGNCIIRGGYELAGYYGETDMNSAELVVDTLRERDNGDIPPHLILLLNEDGERKFYLDTSRRDSRGECPVVGAELGFYDAEEDKDFADSFVEFIIRRLQ